MYRYEWVDAGGTVTDLSSRESWLRVLEVDGLDMPPFEIETSRAPNQHGADVEQVRADARSIGLTVLVRTGDDPSTVKRQLSTIWSPLAGDARLRIINLVTGAVHEAREVRYQERMDSTRWPWAVGYVKTVVRFVAHDPWLYDPEQRTIRFDLGAGTQTFAVPTPVPTGVGSSTLAGSYRIEYKGTWMARPVVTILGPITTPIITNTSTGDRLAFKAGVTIPAGGRYVIDCREGVLTVRDGNGALRTNELTDDSNLSTFRIATTPDAPGGVNIITASGSGVTTATAVYVSFHPRFLEV